MSDSEQDQLAGELARFVVSRLAPGELAGFDAGLDEFLERRDGAGGAALAAAPSTLFEGMPRAGVTSVALLVASEVAQFLIGEIIKAVKQEAAGSVRDAVRALLRRLRAALSAKGRGPDEPSPAEPETLPPMPIDLGPDRLGQIRALVHGKATELNLAEPEAVRLAQTVVEALAP